MHNAPNGDLGLTGTPPSVSLARLGKECANRALCIVVLHISLSAPREWRSALIEENFL